MSGFMLVPNPSVFPTAWYSRCRDPERTMMHLDIELPGTLDGGRVEATVEAVCATANLSATMKTTLKKFPGCVHWHFKKPGETGILEVTWWPRDNGTRPPRLWLSVHGNRTADWIDHIQPRIKKALEVSLTN